MRTATARLLSVRRGLPLFLTIVVALAAWQVWLTWRLMEQDRKLAAQRSRERLEQAADLAISDLVNTLGEWDLRLRELETLPSPVTWRAQLPPDGTLLLMTSRSISAYPPRPLLFVPTPPSPSGALRGEFATVEQLEYRDQQYERAIEALRPLADESATRAEALLRIARLERKLNHPEAALAAYARLCREGAPSTSGVPYALLAAGARCQLLSAAGSPRRVAAEAESLRAALLEGRWPLRRETFEFYWSEMNRLRETHEDPPQASLDLAATASELYKRWQHGETSAREVRPDSSLLAWRASPARLSAVVVPAGWLGSTFTLPPNLADIRWRLLLGPTGQQRSGNAERIVARSLADLKPGAEIEFWSASTGAERGLTRTLWLAAVALMLLLVLGGAYATYRGVGRELRVGQLQSDFVSAVSHEFRSPLTTLRSITEMLVSDRISEEGRRRQSYVFLERETIRLQRLVEDLLDFGRLESGRKQYRIKPHDVFALVCAAVADFRDDALSNGFQIDMNLDSVTATVQGDEDALRRAIRNLLENAVKYSPECRTIRVEGSVHHDKVAISVRDHGMGIEPEEQSAIFQKFVRGAAAKKAGIKGTGIGLAIVRQSVEAMGGEVRLQSTVGVGSTFTIVLPVDKRAGTGV